MARQEFKGFVTLLGGFLALLAATFFGLHNALTRRGVLTGSVLQGLSISVPIGVPIFFVGALATGGVGQITGFPANSVLLLTTAGIAHFVWGRFCNYMAIQAMGANLAGPVQQSSLLIALAMAIFFLGEVLTPLRLIGIFLILSGPVVMLRSRKARKEKAPDEEPDKTATKFQPKYAKGYTFAFLSALGYGSSAVLIRAAVIDTGFGGSLAGGVIAYGAAASVVIVVLLYPPFTREVTNMNRATAKWFTLSGIFVCTSQMLRFMALAVAPVTVVTPIQQTTAIFRVIFGWLINREYEDFSVWVLTGIAVSLLGALTLTLSTEFVIANLPLPDALISIARWQWP
ncbi:MAG: EamA family transporter [Rhodospirillales bacterium]|nr:EamA family transporter [Rhodospirillales bacterium]MDP6644123.1 EamA family transporter [Rhodospirillales bacterium]MDP6843616.1 EamA family transporter [Rhodospirillales bacterium]